MADTNPYRLPRTVEPERYELTLRPDLDASRFSGEEKVQVKIAEPIDEIRLNSAELEIISAELIDDAGNQLSGTVTHDEEAEVATIALSGTAQPGSLVLHLTFTGMLNDKLRGFYRSTYSDDQGVERVIATTQFEATDARRAFPCWDEPDFKAVFAVTLIVEDSLTALSNAGELEVTSLGDGKRQIEFEDTMKMSTYLVAFVVGPLTVSRTVDVDGTPLRVACVPGREALTEFALEVGEASLRYFTDYFGIPYPGGKLDMIALPDFAFGAMENLGCVTFRETALLVDPERASRLEVERVADVVAHEIAHMWFGDLVTMKWWNGIWLNEAFATFMELLFVDAFRPEWERWVSFGLSKSAAMSVDSLSSTRPIEFEVIRPEEAQGMFDLLTYEKGGSVLRMLEQYIGPEKFRMGIGAYLEEHAYGNAETTDLWDAIEGASNEPVRALMDSWIFQGGHPIVHVEPTDDDTGLRLTQKRFRFLGDNAEGALGDSSASALWHVPISVRATVDGELHVQKVLLTDESVELKLPGKPEWVVVNEGANGFYRVSYEPELLRSIMNNMDALDSLERFIIVTDAWAACLAGTFATADVLHLISVMKNEDDPNVWGAMSAPLRMLDKMVTGPNAEKLQSFVRALTRAKYDQLGWAPRAGEGERTATLRGTVIGLLGALGADVEVRMEAAARYTAYENDPTALDPNLIEPVEMVLAASNDPAWYEKLYEKFMNESSTPQEKVNALQALACFTEPSLVERTLEMISDGRVRTQDAPYTVRVMLARKEAGLRTWEWCEERWSELAERFPDNSIARMLDGVTAQTDPALAARVPAFMADHPVPQAQKSVDQTCERLRVNVAFYERNVANVDSMFD